MTIDEMFSISEKFIFECTPLENKMTKSLNFIKKMRQRHQSLITVAIKFL